MKKVRDTNSILKQILLEINGLSKEINEIKDSIKLIDLKYDIHEKLNDIKSNSNIKNERINQ